MHDVNGNLIYDQPNEQIAFIDSLVEPYFIEAVVADSLRNDTMLNDSSSTINNIVINPTEGLSQIKNFEMALFQEIDSLQRFMKAIVAKENQINFVFKIPTSNAQIRALDLNPDANWFRREMNETRDTLIYWLRDVDKDSLEFEISDNNSVLDTINMSILKRVTGRKEKKDTAEFKALIIRSGLKGKTCELSKPIDFTFGYPVEKFDFSKIQLLEHDSIPVEAGYAFSDSINRKLSVDYKWQESAKYKLIIPDSLFFDIHGQSNDTLVVQFTAKSLDSYGNLYINITLLNPGSNHIIQLIKKDQVIQEKALMEDGLVRFEYINPGDYNVKVIYDDNHNGIWDTGDYIYNIQPERVDFFPVTITIRGNWDMEEDWEL
ncbi:MAG: hypothetical protein R2764_14170 [Bacteroidales bacterium]